MGRQPALNQAAVGTERQRAVVAVAGPVAVGGLVAVVVMRAFRPLLSLVMPAWAVSFGLALVGWLRRGRVAESGPSRSGWS